VKSSWSFILQRDGSNSAIWHTDIYTFPTAFSILSHPLSYKGVYLNFSSRFTKIILFEQEKTLQCYSILMTMYDTISPFFLLCPSPN